MAQRLNKNLVVGLTMAGMVLITVAGVAMIFTFPGKDPKPLVEEAEKQAAKGEYEDAMKLYHKAWGRARESKQAEASQYLILAGDMALKVGDARQARAFWDQVMRAEQTSPAREAAQERIVKLHYEFAKIVGGRDWASLQTEAEKLVSPPPKGINPNNYVGLHCLGLALVKQRGADEKYAKLGEEKLKAAVDGDRSNPEYADSLADFYQSDNRFDDALRVYTVLIQQYPPKDPEQLAKAYLYRGTFFLQRKNQLLTQLQQKAGSASPAELDAMKRQIRDVDDKAHGDLEQAVKLAPKAVEALVGLGQYWQLKGSLAADEATRTKEAVAFREQAKSCYKRAIEADPNDFKGYRQLAGLYWSQGENDNALEVLRRRLERPVKREHYLAFLNLASMAAVRDDMFRVYMAKLFALPQDNKAEYERQHKTLMDEMGELCRQAIADSAKGEEDAGVLYMKGRLLMLDGKNTEALKVLVQADKQVGGVVVELKRTLAELQLRAGLPRDARESLYVVLREFPNDPVSLTLLAKACLGVYTPEHPEELDKALAAAQTVLKISPKSIEALQVVYQVYRQQGNIEGMKKIQVLVDESQGVDQTRKKLHQGMSLLMQPEDAAALAEGEKLCKQVLVEDPYEVAALQSILQNYARRMDAVDKAQQGELAAQIKNILASAKAAAEKQHAQTPSTTRPAVDAEKRYKRMLEAIELFGIYADVNASDEERIRRREEMIKRGEDPFLVAVQLSYMYRALPNRMDDALEQLKKADQLKPNDPAVVDSLFLMAVAKKNWSLAEECVEKASKANLDPSGGHFYRGRLLLARSQEKPELLLTARDEIRAGLNQFPDFPNGPMWLGEAFMRLKQYDRANETFKDAARRSPQNGAAAVGLAMVAAARGEEKALDGYLDVCARLAPNHPWVREKLAERAEELHPVEGIKTRQARRKQDPKDLENLLKLAHLYVRAGQLDTAAVTYEECRKLAPSNYYVIQNYAQFLARKQPPDSAGAEKLVREAIQATDPKQPLMKALFQLTLASQLWAAAHPGGTESPKHAADQADEAFRAAAGFASTPEVFADIANHFLRTRRFQEAEQWFRKAVAATKDNANVEDQKSPRASLIGTLLASRDRARLDDIQKEIDSYHSLFPDDPASYLYQGRLEALRADDAKAIVSFGKHIQTAPQLPIGYYERALAFLRRSHWDEAIQDLKEIKRLDPAYGSYQPRLFLAAAWESKAVESKGPEKKTQSDAAIDELQSVLAEDPNNLLAIQNLLRIYAKIERWDSAESLVALRAKSAPDNPVWARLRAQIASAQNHGDQAISMSLDAVNNCKNPAERPDYVDALLNEYLKFEHYDEVISFVNTKIPADQQDSLVKVRLGTAYAGKKDGDKALDWYIKSLDTDRPAIDPLMLTLRTDLPRRLRVTTFVEAINRRLATNPQDVAVRAISAIIERLSGKSAKFFESGRSLLKGYSKEDVKHQALYVLVMREMALVLQAADQIQEAKDLYQKVLEVAPTDLMALNNLAFLVMDKFKDPASARPLAQKAAEIGPENAGVLDTLGWNHVLLKEYDEGIATLRLAIEYNGSIATLHYHTAEGFFRRASAEGAKDKQGDLEEAKTELRRAHALIMQTGQDAEGIFPQLLALGEKLGLDLPKLPSTAPAKAAP